MEVRKVQVATSGHISWGGAGMGEVLYRVRVAVTPPNVETAMAITCTLCAAAGLRYICGALASFQS